MSPRDNRFYREAPSTARDPQTILRALLIAAPQHQGGHSASGHAIAEALEVPFPLTMPSLRAAAIDSGFMPYDLWPWLERMENPS